MTHDGLDGLWRARERRYAAIVLDMLLPGMNGFEVCRTLREEGVGTPILMLTAKRGEYDEAEALDTGADDFLSKPFSFVVLVARLRALARRGASRPPTLVVGDLVVDPAGRTCHRGDAPVPLTPRELALLRRSCAATATSPRSTTCCTRCGATTSTATPTSSRCTSGYLRRKIDAPVRPQHPADRARRRLPDGGRWLTVPLRRPAGCARCGCA